MLYYLNVVLKPKMLHFTIYLNNIMFSILHELVGYENMILQNATTEVNPFYHIESFGTQLHHKPP